MKILHIDLERGWRGGEQQVAYLLQHLRELGAESSLAARPDEPMARWAEAGDFPVFPVTSWPLAAPRLARQIRAEGIDVVHTHSSRSQNLGLLLRTLAPAVPLVASRRVDFHRHGGALNRWKYGTPLVSRWIAVSHKVRGVLVADGVPEDRIAVIHSGVDTERIESARPSKPERARLREELGAAPETFLVGSVGALVPHKDRTTLIRAISQVAQREPRAMLVIAGEGEERRALEGLVAQLDLQTQVRLLGHREDVARLLHGMDLFVLASREEGLGTSVLDAMAAGLPVVVSEAGGLPEMIQPGRNGLVVPPAQPDALAGAIETMIKDEGLRKKTGGHNRKDVERFSARNTARQTLALYQQITGIPASHE